jgi:hypothetical protein
VSGAGNEGPTALAVGALVVCSAEPRCGVMRIVAMLEVDGVPHARLLLYSDGSVIVRPAAALSPCPAGMPAANNP